MKAYIAITGLVFALLTISHLVRVATESTRVLTDPLFVIFTILPAALAIWAVIRRTQRHRGTEAKQRNPGHKTLFVQSHSSPQLKNVAKPYSAENINQRIDQWRTQGRFSTLQKLLEMMQSFQRRWN